MAVLFKIYSDNVAAEWHPEVINLINKNTKVTTRNSLKNCPTNLFSRMRIV